MEKQEFLTHWKLLYPKIDSVENNGETFQGKMGEELHVKCPFCAKRRRDLGPDKSFHCHVIYKSNWCKCFRCGTKAHINQLLGKTKEWKANSNTKQKPWETYIYDPSSEREKEEKWRSLRNKERESNARVGTTIWLGDTPKSHVAWKYLLSEGFSVQELETLLKLYPIHYCTSGVQYTKKPLNTTHHRLIFTIVEGEKTLGWQARFLPESWPPNEEDLVKVKEKKIDKYITSPGMKKSSLFYNWDLAQRWDTWVVVEGVKKVWKTGPYALGSFGINNSLSLPEGATPEEEEAFWFNRLRDSGRRILFLYDRNAIDVAEEIVEKLRKGGVKEAQALVLPHGEPDDLDGYTRPEITAMILKQTGRLPSRVKE